MSTERIADEEALFAGLAAGNLTAEQQLRLAAALRGDAGLRRRLRRWVAFTARLGAAAARPPASTAPRSSAGLRQASVRPRVSWIPWRWAAAAAVLVLGLGAALAVRSGHGADGDGDTVAPPTELASDGTFAASSRDTALELPNRSRLDLEPGSAGAVMPAVGDAAPVVRLDSGGASLRARNGSREVRIQTAPASVAAQGEVMVHYLEVPEGDQPAVEVSVGHGSARIDLPGGKQRNLRKGDAHLVVPDGCVRAEVARVDLEKQELTLAADHGHHRWAIPFTAARITTSDGQPLDPTVLAGGWKALVHLGGPDAQVGRIEIPLQTVSGTTTAWDPLTRQLAIHRPGGAAHEAWTISPEVQVGDLRIGTRIRLSIDPRTREVERVAPAEAPAHAPAEGKPVREPGGAHPAPR